MSPRTNLLRAFDLALRTYPSAFRQRFGAAMRRDFLDAVAGRRASRGRVPAAIFAGRALANTIANGWAERRFDRRRRHLAARRLPPLEIAWRDLRVAARRLTRQPGVTGLSVGTLAIGIGATTAIFSLLDATLLRPLPFDRPGELVSLAETLDAQPGAVALDNLLDWKRDTRALAALTPFQAQSVNLTGVSTPDRMRGGFVTSDFFTVVGVHAALGRSLVPADDDPAAPVVAVLNDAAWHRQFGGDPSVVGRIIQLNNGPAQIVGIMPRAFRFPIDDVDVWLPARQFTGSVGRSAHNLDAIGRLRSGTSVEQAQADLDGIAARLAQVYPATNAGRGVRVSPLHARLINGIDRPLVLAFGLVLLLMAIVCANVSGLQLGAMAVRREELAVRVALGAGAGRVAWLLMTEHLLLAISGGAIGVAIAAALVPMAIHAAPATIFGLDRVRIDLRAVLFASSMATLAGLAGGLVSAWHWSRRRPADALRHGGRVAGDRRLTRVRSLLVAAQVALAVVILFASGLLVRTYGALLRIDPGFQSADVLTLEYRLPRNKYPTPEQQERFHEDVVRAVSAVPGAQRVALVRALPMSGNADSVSYLTDPAAPEGQARRSGLNTVTAGYFDTMGIPVIEGRGFDSRDRAGAPPVVIVSRSLAARAWPGASPLGREIRFAGLDIRPRIVGVVGDVRHADLAEAAPEMIYTHMAQNPGIFMTLVVRADRDALALGDAVRRAVWTVDRDQPVWKIRTLQSLVDRSIQLERFLLGVLALFGAAALVLATSGLYGIVAQSVNQRRQEIGVRLALGATRREIVRLVVASGMKLSGAGLAIGLLASAAAGQWMTSVLYHVTAFDLPTHVSVIVVLAAVTLAACYVPATRAAGADPARTLRDS